MELLAVAESRLALTDDAVALVSTGCRSTTPDPNRVTMTKEIAR